MTTRVIALLAAVLATIPAAAQEAYPSKPVRLVIPFAPSGPADLIARIVGQKLTEEFGKQFYIENHAGAGGNIGTALAARAPADGYTLLINSQALVINASLYKSLPYDPDKDFVPISWMDAGHLPTIVNKNVPAKNIKEFAEFARNNKTSMGTYGAGSYSHCAVEALNRHYKLAMQAVHYRGEAPMWIDVASGAVQAGSGSYAAAAAVLQSGNGRAIAVPTKTRMRKLPDVGTFLEQGIDDKAFQVQGFICLVGPAAMPKDIVLKLSDMMVEAGKSERIQKILDTFGIDMAAQDHVFFEKILAEQGPIWIELVKGLNLEPQ